MPPTHPSKWLIIAHEDNDYVDKVSQHFQGMGWDVKCAQEMGDVRRLAMKHADSIVVMSTDFPGESGWLTCAKLLQEHPNRKVVLVSPEGTPDRVRFSNFVGGAALIAQKDGIRALVDQVYEVSTLPAAG